MIKLNVDINVKNHDEIIKSHKGAALGGIGSLFGFSRNKVEEEIKKQVKLALQESLEEQLIKNGVKADVFVY